MDKLIALPWQIQLIVASGYAAYALSYVGIRAHHTGIEIAFSTLLFGLVTLAALFGFFVLDWINVYWSSFFAFVLTIVAGFFWRKYGRWWLREGIKKIGVSQADDDPSAWHALLDDTKHAVSQLAVRLNDGRWLRCDDTRKFIDAPFGPCILGGSGDVIIYVTHIKEVDGETKEITTTLEDRFGARLCYIPKENISYVNVRHTKR